MRYIFAISLFLITYTYLIYPGILILIASFKKKRAVPLVVELPSVSLVIAAYNEEAVIEDKIKNCLQLDYPKEKLQVVFGSDGSTDRTNEIISRYAKDNIVLRSFDRRSGKPSVLDRTVKQASGDIIVFSDADTFLGKDSLKNIVKGFADKKVGCVCGKIVLKNREKKILPENIYWRYESWIKMMESAAGSVSGAAGGLYAIRKELWRDIPKDTLIDDFVISMKIAQKGYAVLYEPDALGYEETASSSPEEFIRRVRIGAGGYQAILILRGALDPFKGGVFFRFWSHKVIRWMVPFLLPLIFISNIYLAAGNRAYYCILLCQLGFYIAALSGGILQKIKVNVFIFNAVYHFVLMNAALGLGLFGFVLGLQKVTWRKAAKAAYCRL